MPLTGFIPARIGRKPAVRYGRWRVLPSPPCCARGPEPGSDRAVPPASGDLSVPVWCPLIGMVLLDTYPPEKYGSAMALWGLVSRAPFGAVAGAGSPSTHNWRWVFINPPFGLAGLSTCRLHRGDEDRCQPPLRSAGVRPAESRHRALQTALTGESPQNWFGQREIVIETAPDGDGVLPFVGAYLHPPAPLHRTGPVPIANFSVGLLFHSSSASSCWRP